MFHFYHGQFQVLKCLLLTNAVSWPGRERNVGVWVSFGAIFRQESLWDEGVRFGIYYRTSVKEARSHDDVCTGRNELIFYNNILPDGSRDDGHTLVQPETLLDTHLEVSHVSEVPRGGGPVRVLPEDVPELLLALLLDLGVTRHQVEGEGHVSRRGVVA